jgi:hypothetical protein
MEELKILSLRDLAIAHYPKARKQRADAVKYQGSVWADSGLMSALVFVDYDATAIEKAAHELLQLTVMHPDAQPLDPHTWDAVENAEIIASKARMLEQAVEMRPQIEAAMLDAARLLCELAGVALPPWVDPAPVATSAPAARVPVSVQQNEAILDWLKTNKHEPNCLPVAPEGKAGVKKQCRDALLTESAVLFSSKSVFDTAWERLRANNHIEDAPQ